MAKAKLKKKNKEVRKSSVDEDDEDTVLSTAGNEHAPDKVAVEVEDVNFRGEEDGDYYHVIKGDHSAICKGNSKADAKEAFFKLFGILDTTEPVRVGKIDEDDLSGFKLNEFGVILGTAK